MCNVLKIYKKKLPHKLDEAIEYIYEYFNGFDIKCEEYDNFYQVLITPNQYTYCEDITQGLNYLGISKEKVKEFCFIKNNLAVCLSENWLPFAFAKMKEIDNLDNKSFCVIHIDDHQDLMSPFIYKESEKYINMITKDEIDFNDSYSIRRAVETGAITIGSMLTSIVYTMADIKIIHKKYMTKAKEYGVTKELFKDEIIDDNYSRISIKIDLEKKSHGRYIKTSKWIDVVKQIDANEMCLLHIDMDYFNNRYNATTEWAKHNNRHDPNFSLQKKEIDKLLKNIKIINTKAKIKYVLIGISPSFYPVEYWEKGVEYLLNGLNRNGIITGIKSLKNKNHYNE